MTLANKITVLRIIAVPFFVIALLEDSLRAAQILFLGCIFSDALDGALARLRGERTRLGTFLDPMADKFLLLAAYVTLTFLQQLPLWVFVAVLSRDLLIVMGWTLVVMLTSNSKIEPRPLGKVTTALQMAYVVGVLFDVPSSVQTPLLKCMIAATLLSALDYVWVGNKRLSAIET